MTKKSDPYGDEGGTRVGKPDTPQRPNTGGGDGGNLGAGKESTGGLSERGNPADTKHAPAGSPRRNEDKGSGYGGTRGLPKTDSGQK